MALVHVVSVREQGKRIVSYAVATQYAPIVTEVQSVRNATEIPYATLVVAMGIA